MRIVHVVQGLGIGGQERLVVYLSRELASRGHEASIVSLSRGGALREEANGIRVYDVTRADGADASLVARLAWLLRSLRADVVHTHNPAPMLHAVPAAVLARVRRRIHTKHGANIYGPRGLWAARVAVRALHAVVAVSPQTAEVARWKERVPERRLHVVPNGIPLSPFARPAADSRAVVRRELGIAMNAFVVGSVGRLAKEKDYPTLVAALAPSLSERVRLVLVGEGEARREIEAAIPPQLAAYVTLTGERRDVPELLASFDLFALSSRTEGLPLAVPEAMASSLPVVATAVGGLPSVVSPECGVLVPPGDQEALRAAIESFVRDPPKSRLVGERARREAFERFSVERMADDYEQIYRDGRSGDSGRSFGAASGSPPSKGASALS
ncbi:MAG TPA: glycosyltransferase [Polyangiaceae bacterium]|nr:glycosyltransferase [Polyangiaceae bacterium]